MRLQEIEKNCAGQSFYAYRPLKLALEARLCAALLAADGGEWSCLGTAARKASSPSTRLRRRASCTAASPEAATALAAELIGGEAERSWSGDLAASGWKEANRSESAAATHKRCTR
jgi:hypothetical protein